MRPRWSRVLLLLLLMGQLHGVGADTSPSAMALTQQELDWIATNSVLRVGVYDNLLPFEYISHDQLRGLSAKYLKMITQRTGLHFMPVVSSTRSARRDMLISGEVDILPSRRRSKSPLDDRGMLYTKPYNTSSTILVSRFGDQPFVDLAHLAGKRLVMLGREGYSTYLVKNAPGITIVTAQNAVDIMEMVKDGRADAAIASEWLLIPYLSRQYQGVLQISGVVPELSVGISMAVRESDVILLSILQKALTSVTGDDRMAIYDAWLADMALDIPTIKAIAEHFEEELWLLVAVVALLVTLVWQSWIQRRYAVRREQEKAMFLAVMSHEIRSPMNAVLAAVELLQHTSLDEQQSYLINLTNSGVNTLLRLVDNVLDISKMEAGQFKLNPSSVDLWALTQRVVDAHQPYALEKGLELTLTGVRFNTPMLLDELRLAQILRNLISNAIKFTENGQVDVQLQTLDRTEGDVCHVQIRVIDSGVGLSREAQLSLLRPYARTKHSYKSAGGTGLGLVICRLLVNFMYGKLSLTSTPGVGTQVEVTLPVKLASLSDSTSQTLLVESAKAGDQLQVLVVENSVVNQQALVAHLKSLGCEALLAADAAQGLAIFGTQSVDIVLMNCDLPDEDGYSLVGTFREQEQQRSHCPIFGVSAFSDTDELERCFDAGMDGLLNPPISLAKLQQVIELWCDVDLTPQVQLLPEQIPGGEERSAELRKNISSLIEVIALHDRNRALHILHQLHGVARIVGWTDITPITEEIERVLNGDKSWPAVVIAEHLKVLIKELTELPRRHLPSSK